MPTKIDRLLVWGADGIEPNTLEQARLTAKLPFVHSHVALMPDAHVGIGATVGSVIATHGAIVPAAVGVDIGCGMIATRTDLAATDLPDDLGALHSAIAAAIPSGVGQGHASPFNERVNTPPAWARRDAQPAMVERSNKLWDKTRAQFGTLGSGNHFVEVCLDEDDRVWLVLHSGSRGVGNEIAKRHIEGAKKIMKQYFVALDDPDLAYFAEGTPDFDEYIHDMLWAQDYARTNREQMMVAAVTALTDAVARRVVAVQTVNAHHNYTEQEHHHGRNLWVTRKGAIRARADDWGIIPGSMATGTYIVQGLGNVASFTSASHGAGRRMSRGVARRTVTEDELREAMAGKAWNDAEAKALLDEAPAAYKPIEDVMDAQADLVEVRHKLRQVLNYKGT
jgi:tRNA-splicing ligase RtcB